MSCHAWLTVARASHPCDSKSDLGFCINILCR